MARIKLEIPKSYPFSTEIPVRITDLNYGGHLGNDALLSLMHEARIRFLKAFQTSELDFSGHGLIMADVAIQYKSEAFAGEILCFQMTAYDFSITSFDLFYYITCKNDGRVVALAKTQMVVFDYQEKKMKEVPPVFRAQFPA